MADDKKSNNPPDVILELTHEQATFVLENFQANKRMALSLIMAIGEEKIPVAEKRRKAKKLVEVNEKFSEITRLLVRAGARNGDDVDEG